MVPEVCLMMMMTVKVRDHVFIKNKSKETTDVFEDVSNPHIRKSVTANIKIINSLKRGKFKSLITIFCDWRMSRKFKKFYFHLGHSLFCHHKSVNEKGKTGQI